MASTSSRLHAIVRVLSNTKETASTPAPSVLAAKPSTLTRSERANLIQRVATARDTMHQMPNNDGLITLLQTVSRDVAARKITNEQIEATAPEILQAASIIIPLIMAPNELRHSATAIQCSLTQLSSDQQQKIGQAVTEYFDKHYQLQNRLPRYIKAAKYGEGAQPVLVIPTSELDRQFNDDTHAFISTEALISQYERHSLFGITSMPNDATTFSTEAFGEICITATESLFAGIPGIELKPKSYDRQADAEKNKAIAQLAKRFLASEALALTDNPGVAQANTLAQKKTEHHMRKTLDAAYRQKGTISLHGPDGAGSQGDPLVMELPAESVIPIFPPGSPNDHIGYFVALDELGNPIHVTREMANAIDLQHDNQDTFRSLFRAFGLGDMTPIFGQQHQLMTNVYQKVVEAYLKAKMGSAKMSGLDIGSDNAVFRCMFTRYLRQRQTRLLFVPKDLMAYYCFKYNDNGTGRSKLEELQYILSLRITLLVCRQMTAVMNAMDRRKITTNLPAGYRGNVMEYMNDVHRATVRKMVVVPSLDPEEIQRTISGKSISIAVTNIPGAEDFNITNEANERTAVTIDTDLMQDVTNLLVLGLDLTPSMMNALNDAEYSRSVATNNLTLSRKIIQDQETLCYHNDQLVRTVAKYSGPLRDIIANIIKGEDEGDTERGVAAEKTGGVDVDTVIASLKTVLPRPSVAPDRAQFETLEAFIQQVDGMWAGAYPDDLANGDSEVGEGIAFIRALVKAENIRQFINNSGLNNSINLPDINQMVNESYVGLQLRQAIWNFKRGLEIQKTLTSDEGGGATDGGDTYGGGDADQFGGNETQPPADGEQPPDDGTMPEDDGSQSDDEKDLAQGGPE